jgi:hypothetical protein
MMTDLTYPLSILVRAVAFRNLSSAALHVGLSQPQLSRLIAKIETELGVELLNRTVKRNSSWTPQAMKLAELFQENQRRLEHSIRALQSGQRARQVHIGTLEGLADTAMIYSKKLFEKADLELIFIDVFDRNELEAKYLAGDLDLILNTRVPSHAKPRHILVCGYQSLDMLEKSKAYTLYSTFEFNLRTRPKRLANDKTVVSNSLYVRREWMERYGGHGSMPSALIDKPKRGFDEVYLIGGDWLDAHIWQVLNENT